MHKRLALGLLALLLSSSAAAAKPETAEDAYQAARKEYYALKEDAARRKFRHHWLNVARRFQSVAARFPNSARAPDALFTAAEMLSELSRISYVDEDLRAAMADYSKLLSDHPAHRLTDDAALALARIHINRLDEPQAARRILEDALTRLPKGDQYQEMKRLLASLPPPPKPAPASKPVPVATKAPETPKAPETRKAPEAPKAEPVVAEKKSEERPANSALVEAISKIAREPSPIAPPEKSSPEAVAATEKQAEPAPKPEAEKKPETPSAAPAVVASAPVKSEPSADVSDAKSLDALVASLTAEPKAEEKKVEKKPAEAEPPSPITAPVDAKVAEARLKAVAKDTRRAELTLAEQLGLKVRRVVIDPGHGGHDTGAIGKKGTREKDVALAIAKKLAAELRKRDLEVMLTREDDRFLRLEERARMANEAQGDLFISIHCNSAESRKLRGVETYTLNTSADRYSIRLAARENATSEKGIGDLQFILADLATKANTEESTRLATQVQKSMVESLSARYSDIKNLGTKEALFYVLLGTKMPAILVETSFLSHPEEEMRLASEAYQNVLARSIAQGVEAFLGDRFRVAQVR